MIVLGEISIFEHFVPSASMYPISILYMHVYLYCQPPQPHTSVLPKKIYGCAVNRISKCSRVLKMYGHVNCVCTCTSSTSKRMYVCVFLHTFTTHTLCTCTYDGSHRRNEKSQSMRTSTSAQQNVSLFCY